MPGPKIYGAAAAKGALMRSAARRYGFALLCAGAATGARWLITPMLGDRVPWIFFFPAVLCAAWYGRLAAGMFCAALGAFAAVFLWLPPPLPRSAQAVEVWTSIAGFLFGSLLISIVAELSHRATRDLELERKFLDTVLSSITDALIVLDPDWRFVYVNDAALKFCRRSQPDLIGHPVWAVFPQLQGTALDRELHRSRENKVPVQFELSFPEQDLWLEFRAHPMDGSTAIYVTDISRRKRTETELAQARNQMADHASNLEWVVQDRTAELQRTVAKLEESVADLEQFSYTISHDLRAPLRAMQGFAALIVEDYGDKLDVRGHDYLDRIQAAAQRMDRLVNDVLLYTRTARGQIRLEPTELDKLVDDIVDQYTPAARGHTTVRHPLGRVRGNEALLTQAISNLLVNAAKFVPPGAEPRIDVWSEQQDGRVRLFVRDRGIGIPAEARPKVFGIFERGHNSSYSGTGIGLAIVKRAVERMNGRVAFDSQVGQGSTFWIELPAA